MKLRYILAVAGMLLVVGCYGGSYKFVGTYNATEQSLSGVVKPDNGETGKGCPLLPDNFKESDLVGTWGTFAGHIGEPMTLTLRADGTYKQVYDSPFSGYHYEGDWQRWELERRDNGTALVHFQEMSTCGETCKLIYSGVVVDSCEQYKSIPIKDNEVALVLMGAPPPKDPTLPPDSPFIALHGIQMIDPSLDPDSGPIVYRLKR